MPSVARCSAAVACLALLWPGPAVVQQSKIFCSEPVQPFCAKADTVFEDNVARERCHDEVEEYVEGMQDYVECLDAQQQDARQRAEAIAARFACMKEGRKDCE